MHESPEDRVERIVSALLKGRRMNLRSGDAAEKEAITMAAQLAAAKQGRQHMTPAFRQKLAKALADAPLEPWLTRRAALVAGFGVAAGALAGGFIGRGLEPTHGIVAAGRTINPKPGRWVDVGALLDMPEGQGVRVSAGAVGAYLFRRGESVTAVSSICSHLPCELNWDGGQSLLSCPCHPVNFSPDGQPTDRTYPLPALNVVQVRVTGAGRVEVLGT